MKTYFDHERLDVYQEAIAFCGGVGELLAGVGREDTDTLVGLLGGLRAPARDGEQIP